jgi:uncharacterized C2H2 Zn-finger protein
MERGIQTNEERHAVPQTSRLRGGGPDGHLTRSPVCVRTRTGRSETHDVHKYTWCSHAGLYCLKPGKYTKIDYDQQVDTQDTDDAEKRKFLRCTECHYVITRKSDRIQINEQHQHVFANPHGYVFHIGCFAQAPGCVIASEETSYFSWFPGYAWQIALCGQCLTLLGWAFRSSESQFFGLILDKLK